MNCQQFLNEFAVARLASDKHSIARFHLGRLPISLKFLPDSPRLYRNDRGRRRGLYVAGHAEVAVDGLCAMHSLRASLDMCILLPRFTKRMV